MAERKFYGMKNDYMFKAVLQCAEDVLRNLVAVLPEIDESEITSCTIENTIELGKSVDSKDCILDVKLLLNSKEIIDLEIQVRNEFNWPERSLLYWSRAYDDLKSGQDYSELKKTYHIGILDFTLFKGNPSFYSEYKILDTETGYEYTDKLNIRILDLTKIPSKAMDSNLKLVKWAKIFRAETMEELEQLAGAEEVFESMVTHLKELSEDEKIRQQCAARDDYERRLIGEYNRGERDGIEVGKALGIEAGKELGKLEMIKNLMKSLNCTADKAVDILIVDGEEKAMYIEKLQ